jgi:hypothetical protein
LSAVAIRKRLRLKGCKFESKGDLGRSPAGDIEANADREQRRGVGSRAAG